MVSKEVSDANLAKLGDYNRGRIAAGGNSLDNNLRLFAGFGGTSPTSKNRYYLSLPDLSGNGEFMKTAIHDPSIGGGNQEATLYDAQRSWGLHYAAGNGEQASLIAFAMESGASFYDAHNSFTHEGPNNRNTPRITIVANRIEDFIYIGRIAPSPEDSEKSIHDYWTPGDTIGFSMEPGEGYLITTYDGKGSEGSADAWDPNYEDPWPILLHGSLEENTDVIWNNWDPLTRAGLVGAEIDVSTGKVTYSLRSIHEGRA